MDTSTPRITEFRRPPAYPNLAQPASAPAPRLTLDRLDQLDRIAQLLIRCKTMTPGHAKGEHPLRLFQDLPEHERIYVALATSDDDLLHFLHLTIAQAIDRLGWVDASAMVARWSKRRV